MAATSSRLLLAAALLLVGQLCVSAQSPGAQGQILYTIGKWLSNNDDAALSALGWSEGGNPCTGWTGITCNSAGYITDINLANRGFKGSLPPDPALWTGLTGLAHMDLSGNSLSGAVPAALKSAPLLDSVNLNGNKGICDYLPLGVVADTSGTSIGTACSAVGSQTEAASPSPSPAADAAPSPSPKLIAESSPSPVPASSSSPPPASASAKPPPAPVTVISNAPICSCALKGFGSRDCAGSLAAVCKGASPPEVCNSTAVIANDTRAAVQLSQYLGQTCFTGQNMDTSICTCVQNLLGNDCAKARVSLCINSDPLCLPFQNIIDESGGGSVDAAAQVATALGSKCDVVEPTQPGVKATMEFPDLSMGQYITRQYTQNVANALSSVSNVPTSAISTLDVRPFVSKIAATNGQRRLLQAGSGNGVQATYFLATEDPSAISDRLSKAAADGTLSARLAQYGITAQAGGLRVQSYLQPPAPAADPGGSSFPLWAIAPILIGILLLLGLLGGVLWFFFIKKKQRGKKAAEYAPGVTAAPAVPVPATKGYRKTPPSRMPDGPFPAADITSKIYDVTPPTGASGYKASGDSYATQPGAIYKAPPAAAAALRETPGAAVGNGKSKVPSRPESPASSKGSARMAAPAGVAGAAAAVAAAAPNSGPNDLPVSRSMRVPSQDEALARAGSGTLTPWESVGRSNGLPGSAPSPAKNGTSAAHLQHLTSLRPTGSSSAAAAVGAGAAAGAGNALLSGPQGSLASEGSSQAQGSTWRSNVRPASGSLPNTGGATSSMSNPTAKSNQQAERAKFWAQFQETWQQVRQTQKFDNEPGSPSSGTNWTDITDARTARH